MRRRNTQVSSERQTAFNLSTVMIGAGMVLALVGFVGFATAGKAAVTSFGGGGGGSDPFAWWLAVLAGMVLAAIGRGMRTVAARGIAGSGLVLDPERARKDLEPFARMGGGMLKDAIDESGLALGQQPAPPAETVKVRCSKCRALAEETAKFCPQCANPM